MHVVAISTEKSLYVFNLKQTFKDLIESKEPFTVHMDFMGSTFPIPFANGKAINGLIEQSVRDVLKQTFGTIEYEYSSTTSSHL